MPKKPDLPHLQVHAGGGIVFRLVNNKAEVLLIHRKGLWDLPKGKLDDGESIAQCAAREVAEETGSEWPVIVKELASTVHHYEENSQVIEKITHWFMMFIRNNSFHPQHEEDIDEVRWVFIDDAIDKVGYDNLQAVLREFRNNML